jgi:hypothetical protein
LQYICACRWYAENDLEVYGVTHKSALTAFFLAAANIFEPNRADERLGWARTAVLAEAISSRLNSLEERFRPDALILDI